MTKVQFSATCDCNSLASFSASTGWALQLSNALVSVGWVRVSDPNSTFVVFANITLAILQGISSTVGGTNRIPTPGLVGRYQGAFDTTGSTAYTGSLNDNATIDWVTSSGVTYICLQSTRMTDGITSVSNPSGTQWQYNSSGNAFTVRAGDSIKITAGSSSPISANNQGTFTVAASPAPTAGAFQVTASFAGTVETKNGTLTEATAPASDLFTDVTSTGLVGHWAMYAFEVFSLNDTAQSTGPIYLKITYNPWLITTNTTWTANMSLLIGTGVVNSGSATNYMQITGNIFNNLSIAGVLQNPEIRMINGGSPTAGSFECDVSSDGSSLSFIMWRTATSNHMNFILDRARDNNGNPLDNYVFIGFSSTAGASKACQTLMKPGSGYAFPIGIITTCFPTIQFPTLVTNTALFGGLVPALPIFPLVGYVGNPILAAVCFKLADVLEGSLIQVVLYGASHSFIVTKINLPANLTSGDGSSGEAAIAMRFE